MPRKLILIMLAILAGGTALFILSKFGIYIIRFDRVNLPRLFFISTIGVVVMGAFCTWIVLFGGRIRDTIRDIEIK